MNDGVSVVVNVGGERVAMIDPRNHNELVEALASLSPQELADASLHASEYAIRAVRTLSCLLCTCERAPYLRDGHGAATERVEHDIA